MCAPVRFRRDSPIVQIVHTEHLPRSNRRVPVWTVTFPMLTLECKWFEPCVIYLSLVNRNEGLPHCSLTSLRPIWIEGQFEPKKNGSNQKSRSYNYLRNIGHRSNFFFILFNENSDFELNSCPFALKICSVCLQWRCGGHHILHFSWCDRNCLLGQISVFLYRTCHILI